MGTILSVAVLYVFAATALTAMQPYSLISGTSGFADAFQYRNVNWAAQIAALGEVRAHATHTRLWPRSY